MVLSLYILRRFLLSFFGTLAGTTLVLFPPLLLSALQRLHGIGLGQLLRYLPLHSIELLPYLVPMAFLVATIGTFGRLAADGEWTAIVMAGHFPLRAMLPAFVVAAVLSGTSMVLLGEYYPEGRFLQRVVIRNVARELVAGLFPGSTNVHMGEFALLSRGRRGNVLYDVVVSVPRPEEDEKQQKAGKEDDPGRAEPSKRDRPDEGAPGQDDQPTETFFARSVELGCDGDVLTLEFEGIQGGRGSWQASSERASVSLPLDDIIKSRRVNPDSPRYTRSSELRRRLAGEDLSAEERTESAYQLHRRDALAATFLIFALLGIPTGLLVRSGSMLTAMSLAVGYACGYYVLSIQLGEIISRAGAVPAWVGAWGTNLLAACVGIFLLYRSLRR